MKLKKALLLSMVGILSGTSLQVKSDEVIFDGNKRMSGIKIVSDPDNTDNKVSIWRNSAKGHRSPIALKEKDLSEFKAISFRFYSAEADNHGIVVLCESNNDKTQGYFYKKFVANWKGWKSIVIPFDEFTISRKPVGWKKINKILLANNGYCGTKPNKNGRYYIDDVKVLKELPPSKQLKQGESIELNTTNPSNTYQFKIDPSQENIYGIQYEVSGLPGAKVKIHEYKTWDKDNELRQNVTVMGHSWKPVVSKDWEKKQIEFLTKKGAATLSLKFTLAGDIPIKIQNVKTVKGGFPENPPLAEAPYLAWIDSLKPNLEFAKTSPLLLFQEGGVGLWEHSKGRTVFLKDSDVKDFEKSVASYRALSVKQLAELMPVKRPFHFRGGYWGDRYKWSPEDPDNLYDIKTGKLFDYKKKYPIEGYEKAVAPSGKEVTYAYHDSSKKDKKFKGERIYVDRFMTDTRMNAMCRAGYKMAMLYRKTGDMEYGVRAAAILWAMAKNMPDWPVTGQPSWNSPKEEKRLREPDYYEWFSFVMDGNWYVNNSGVLMWPLRYFDLIRDFPVWKTLSQKVNHPDTEIETANGLLHVAKMIIIRDAYHRFSEFVFFHNLSGTANRSLILAGRVLGIPELVHYGVRKVTGTFRRRFMADGVFPESQWYSLDQIIRQSQAIKKLTGYNDPPGYISSFNGTRLDIIDPEKSIPAFSKIMNALYRQSYPNGDASTIHDSWSETSNPTNKKYSFRFPARETVIPHLYNAYGQGVIGRGTTPNRIESQLHFGGFYNHGHRDMLNFTLWAYGDELIGDIGYSHITQFNGSTIAHNLVMVNQSNQRKNKHNGSLLAWNARRGASQLIQASQGEDKVYPECKTYRRALLLLPFGKTNNLILDIFEVNGGKSHDWLARGCLDYKQKIKSTLNTEKTLDNLAKDGIPIENPMPWGDDNKTKYTQDKYGVPSIFYGAIRNAKLSNITSQWTATMEPPSPVPTDTVGAGAKAKTSVPKPSLRLHWLAPLDGTAIIAEAPSNRYDNELHNKPAARKAWSKNLIPQIIVKREGINLKSRFIAAWEPFHDKSFIDKIIPLHILLTGEEKGWIITSGDETKAVLYQSPEEKRMLNTKAFSSDGRFSIMSTCKGITALDLYDGNIIETKDLKAELQASPKLNVTGLALANNKFIISVDGILPDAEYSNEYLCFSLQGHSNRWLRLSRIINKGVKSQIILAEDPGFIFDAQKNILRETYFPHRALSGKATVTLPGWLNIKQGTSILLRASKKVKLTLKNYKGNKYLVSERQGNGKWKKLKYRKQRNNLIISITPRRISNDWIEIKVRKNEEK